MWTEVIAGIIILLLVIIFGFDRSRLSKKAGRLEAERDDERRKKETFEDALAILISPDPTLDELERMSKAAAGIDSVKSSMPVMEQGRIDRILRPSSDSETRKTNW